MKPPKGSLVGIPMEVRPIPFHEFLSSPLRGLTVDITNETRKRVFKSGDPRVELGQPPSPIWVEEMTRPICFQGKGVHKVGISVCGLTLPMPKENSNTIVNKSDPTGQKQITFTMNYTLHHDKGMIPPKGIFLVCGDKAYPYLPKGWEGVVI